MIWVDADVVLVGSDGQPAALSITGPDRSEVVGCPPGLATAFSVRAGDKVRIAISDAGSTIRAMRPAKGDRTVIAACARWETNYIVEWIEYHVSIGVDHIYLYCNDEDPTELFEAVRPYTAASNHLVTFRHYPFVGLQKFMYLDFLKNHSLQSDWFTFIDVDEFISIRNGMRLKPFLRQFEEWDVVYLNWLMFGPKDFVERPPGSVLMQYDRRQSWVNTYTKTFTRSTAVDLDLADELLESGFWHNWPKEILYRPERRCNVVFDPLADYYDDFPRTARAYLDRPGVQDRIRSAAVLNHYSFKSHKDIEYRLRRSLLGDFAGQNHLQAVLDTGTVENFMRQFDEVTDRTLASIWSERHREGSSTSVVPRSPFQLLSRGQPATQSSVCEWSACDTPEAEAQRGVTGVFTGGHAFHTGQDQTPWWRVDLGGPCAISEVHLYNRLTPDFAKARARRLAIDVSGDGEAWVEVFRKDDDTSFGGVDGDPLVWRAVEPVDGRHVRVRLLGEGFLHLDQVEVFGTSDGRTARGSTDGERDVFPAAGADRATRAMTPSRIDGDGIRLDGPSNGASKQGRTDVVFATSARRADLGGNIRFSDANTFHPKLWTYLIDRFAPKSMLDVGCGEGHAVAFFAARRVWAHGIDGLLENVQRAVVPIALHDLLTGPYRMPVDLVWSSEVAEHILPSKVDFYLDTLANGKIVAMTHAVPGQDGHHHVNCQPDEYWIEKMVSRGYVLARQHEVFRKIAAEEASPTYFAASGLVFFRI